MYLSERLQKVIKYATLGELGFTYIVPCGMTQSNIIFFTETTTLSEE